jgi:hypothetical protein
MIELTPSEAKAQEKIFTLLDSMEDNNEIARSTMQGILLKYVLGNIIQDHGFEKAPQILSDAINDGITSLRRFLQS